MECLRCAEFGAWYPRFSVWNLGRPWDRYKIDIQELFDQRLRKYKAHVLWRAYGPTHFGGPTGTYTGDFLLFASAYNAFSTSSWERVGVRPGLRQSFRVCA